MKKNVKLNIVLYNINTLHLNMQLFTNLNNKQNSMPYLINDPKYLFWIMSSANFSMKKALMFSEIFFLQT